MRSKKGHALEPAEEMSETEWNPSRSQPLKSRAERRRFHFIGNCDAA
jgi:hypothetical protein